jgi:hypothetical protein
MVMSSMKTNKFKTIKIFIYIVVEYIVFDYVGENLTFVHRRVGVIFMKCIDKIWNCSTSKTCT